MQIIVYDMSDAIFHFDAIYMGLYNSHNYINK